jgi:hypothetical protein
MPDQMKPGLRWLAFQLPRLGNTIDRSVSLIASHLTSRRCAFAFRDLTGTEQDIGPLPKKRGLDDAQ